MIGMLPGEEERRLVRDLAAPRRPRTLYGRCAFCGHICFGRVCRAHRDLLEVEAEPTALREEQTVGSDREEGTP